LCRVTGGQRKVMAVSEVTGMEGEAVCLQDIFRLRQTGLDEDGHACAHFEACGVRPQMLDRLVEEGADLPADLFRRRVLSGGNGAAK